MDGAPSRADRVPNANNPRMLQRLLGLVGGGLRRPSALAEVLEVELRTVHYYTQAAQWLGLMDTEGELRLTSRGLALAFADPATQRQLYAEAVLANPLAAAILAEAGDGETLPSPESLVGLIQARDPTLSPVTARRRASALRGLVAPALATLRSRPRKTPVQLGLPFGEGRSPVATAADGVDLRAGTEESPDVYRRLLLALLDHGELSTGQIRAVLDQMGARDAPLAPYVDMAQRRGDALRHEDRLVATAGAARRAEVALDAVLVALTDPAYREYLDGMEAGRAALERSQRGAAAPADAELRVKLSRLARRFAPWDQRIFGRRLQPGEVDQALAGLLLGRHFQGLPLAGDTGPALALSEGAFLEQLDLGGLALCFPRALTELKGGVGQVNARLRTEREQPAAVRLPGPVDRRARVHGGLIAPGEPLPRAIPDNLSLRLKALAQVPALSMLAALLLAGRRGNRPPQVRVQGLQDRPMVHVRGLEPGPLLALLARFAQAQGWTLLLPPADGLSDAALALLAEELGIATRTSGQLLLDEGLFSRLQEDPECRLTYEALLPLEDRLLGWLSGT